MDRSASSQIVTKRIRLWGIVQGVGFRPYVAKLADSLNMKGEVRNLGGLVEIVVSSDEDLISSFLSELKANKPLPAEIVHIKIEDLPLRLFDSFVILDSQKGEDETVMIPADLAICPDCLREMRDPQNPRYEHPFISCMACGPRYTLIDHIPYDRQNTAMADFDLCNFCQGEYEDRQSRRYHAQTISCHDCGPYNKILSEEIGGGGIKSQNSKGGSAAFGHAGENRKTLAKAVRIIKEGGILAVKGIGGYNFICSPFNEEAVKALRQLKMREEKPFAILFQDIAQIKDYCQVDEDEERLLGSSARPIVLLARSNQRALKDQPSSNQQTFLMKPIISPEVTKTSRFIGAFLPSTGLHYQLISACGPLIATSANISEAPMTKDDQEMMQRLKELGGLLRTAEKFQPQLGILYNDRDIRIRLDDSVVRVIDKQPQMIRRSKGYAPVPLLIAAEALDRNDMILATGGQLKSAFCLTKGNFAYVSQYLGDLDQQQSCALYDENVERIKTLFGITPGLVVCDLHPLYYTTKFAQEYKEKFSSQLVHEVLMVQHHHAHVASVMAEHDLSGAVIGVSFDGTGYGADGAIWGGEFLICEGAEFRRAAHLGYIRMLGGDSSMKEGWKSAMSYTHAFSLDWPREDNRYNLVAAAIDHNINTIRSSSMGRLFDAMASYIGIHDINRYEGECAIMLENSAAEALESGICPFPMAFDLNEDSCISAGPVFRAANMGIKEGVSAEAMALGFHYAVADMILNTCMRIRSRQGISQVALTGGVFQNKILMERALALLRRENFDVYYNISVGPNDGGICLGQAYIGMQHLTQLKSMRRKSCV